VHQKERPEVERNPFEAHPRDARPDEKRITDRRRRHADGEIHHDQRAEMGLIDADLRPTVVRGSSW
jgi:hypothetical protein